MGVLISRNRAGAAKIGTSDFLKEPLCKKARARCSKAAGAVFSFFLTLPAYANLAEQKEQAVQKNTAQLAQSPISGESLIPVLATFILTATIVTFVAAVAAYIKFKIGERKEKLMKPQAAPAEKMTAAGQLAQAGQHEGREPPRQQGGGQPGSAWPSEGYGPRPPVPKPTPVLPARKFGEAKKVPTPGKIEVYHGDPEQRKKLEKANAVGMLGRLKKAFDASERLMNPRIGRLKADENTLKGLTMLLNDMCESFDKTARMKNASENDMARSLLPVLDSAAMMEEQLSSLKSQEAAKELLISLSDIKKAFETEGFSEMDVKGKKFDPNYHHAIAYVDSKSGLPKDTVDRVAKNGYYFNGEIIRFAEVYLSDRKRVVEATAKVAV